MEGLGREDRGEKEIGKENREGGGESEVEEVRMRRRLGEGEERGGKRGRERERREMVKKQIIACETQEWRKKGKCSVGKSEKAEKTDSDQDTFLPSLIPDYTRKGKQRMKRNATS